MLKTAYEITNLNELSSVINSYSPGESVNVSTYDGTKESVKEITLGTSPDKKAWIGITFINSQASGVGGVISNLISSYKDPHVHYTQNFKGAEFIYNFFWWLVLISFSVAIVNMLPVGIFDGGRFFYLTILSITKSKKAAEVGYKISTYFFLILLFALMILWAKSFF